MELLFALVFWALMFALATVGLVSWRRTRALRTGQTPILTRPIPVTARSSRTTFVSASAGAMVAAAGGGAVARGPPNLVALIVTCIGIWILATGLWSRVTGLEVTRKGLLIRYARRRPFRVALAECRSLRTPLWPLGGWRLEAEHGSRTLMPSDLLGNEHLLDHLVESAGFSFNGRFWLRDGRAVP